MPPLEVRTQVVGPWPMNSYALVCPQTHASALIDPGADPDDLIVMLAGTYPVGIIITHSHLDHIGALDELQARLRVPLYAHPGPRPQDAPLVIDRALDNGEQLTIGNGSVRVYYAPGHIDDQICLADTEGSSIIVGDTIFAGGPGRTWSPTDFQTTLRTLREVVLSWPDDTICYPGHGPAFRLGDLRARISSFVARPHPKAFFGDAEW